jgi:hypothetical protein
VVKTSTQAKLSAYLASGTVTGMLTVSPPAGPSLSSLTFSPNPVIGGSTGTGTVTLTGPAPAGGAVVKLVSASLAAAGPASVTVPAGATSVTFPVRTAVVKTSTPAKFFAYFAGGNVTGMLTVTPPAGPSLSSFSFSPNPVIGGSTCTATVKLTGLAPAGGVVVKLASASLAAAGPASVIVPAGARRGPGGETQQLR